MDAQCQGGQLPVSGPSILLTRPVGRSERFARQLRDRFGADLKIEIAPIMRIESCVGADPLPPGHAVIFTSTSAVQVLCDQMPGTGIAAFCVGTATTQAARDAGWDAICAGRDARELVDTLLANPPEMPLIHLRGSHVRGAVAAQLDAQSVPCTERIVYRQMENSLTVTAQNLLKSASPVILPLFSPRSAELLSARVPQQSGDLWLVTLSDAVTRAWGTTPYARIAQAETPDLPGMLAAMAPLISQVRKLEGGGRAG